jgi:hypothetical protein
MGTEVKSVSLNTLSRPRDWTKITHFSLDTCTRERDFRRSSVFKKLRAVFSLSQSEAGHYEAGLLVHPSTVPLVAERRATRADEADYKRIHSRARKIKAAGSGARWRPLTGRPGTYLTLNTSGRTTRGMAASKKSRAWWLTKDITNGICKQNLWPDQAMEARRLALVAAEGEGDLAALS